MDFIEENEGFIEGGREESIDLLKALSSLKEDSRVVLTLRYFQDLSLKEIAAILDIPEGTVKSRISNGLKEMRKLMKHIIMVESSLINTILIYKEGKI